MTDPTPEEIQENLGEPLPGMPEADRLTTAQSTAPTTYVGDDGQLVEYPPIDPELTAPKSKARAEVIRKAYSAAVSDVRDAHRDEVHTRQVHHCRLAGVLWSPPKTAAQKAEEQVLALIQAHPELAERFGAQE